MTTGACNSIRRLSKLSYIHQASTSKLEAITIGHALERAVERNPDAVACVFARSNIRKSMTQFFEDVEQTAAGLNALKLNRGDRVGVWSANTYEWLQMQFATARTGVIMVNLNPLYRTEELAYALHKTECKALVAGINYRSMDYLPILRQIFTNADSAKPSDIRSARVPSLQKLILMSKQRYLSAAYTFDEMKQAAAGKDRAAVRDIQYRLGIDDPINIQFTSGTTGSPKAATLSHFGVTNVSINLATRLGFDKGVNRICVIPSFYRNFAMLGANMQIAVNGTTLVVPHDWFDSEAALRAVQTEKCTALSGTPAMLIDMMNHGNFANYDLSSVRVCITGGSPCLPSFLRDVKMRMRIKDIRVIYALTEAASVCMTEASASEEQRENTVGSVKGHMELKVIDKAGNLVPRGKPGDVCVRGYANMLGYWNDEKNTKATIDAGRWLRTGDIGIVRHDECLQIVGLEKEMVNRAGETIYPVEVEEAIKKHDAVADIQVVGVPDKRLGEECCAFVILKKDAKLTGQQLQDWLKQHIAPSKIPKHVHFVTKYPLTATGKVRKFKLREEALASLNLHA